MIIINAEKAVDTIECPFIKKLLKKLGIKEYTSSQ
jgi:hypothetical protein